MEAQKGTMGESAMTRTAAAGENIPFEGLRQWQTTGDDPLKLILGSEPVFELVRGIMCIQFLTHSLNSARDSDRVVIVTRAYVASDVSSCYAFITFHSNNRCCRQ